MRIRASIAVALTVMSICLAATVGAQRADDTPTGTSLSMQDLLEEAIFTEESVGDLDAAMEMYREIVARAEADRPYVALAQFRLAMCYVKKDRKDDAAEALRRLVADFPNRKELVAQARTRLAELGVPVPGAGVVLRQVWPHAEDAQGSPSPDGRYLSFTDWRSGDLAVRGLDSGKNRRLTHKGSWVKPGYAEFSVFSPDGTRIAYAWYGVETIYDLRVIGLDGGAPRVVYAQKDTTWIRPLDWTPDGKSILAWLSKRDGLDRLALVSVEDGSVRVLSTLDATDTQRGRTDLSPDGRHIVFSRSQDQDTGKRDVFVVSIEGGRARRLVGHPGDDLVLGWSPDGNQVLFASDRTGAWSAWAIRVTDGKPAGAPVLVKSNLGDLLGRITPMGFTRSGSYYYSVSASMTDVYQAFIDPDTGKVTGPPTKVTQRYEGSNGRPGWSADGKRLAWISKREGAYTLVIRELETGEVREVPVSKSVIRLMEERLCWSPDGRSLLIAGVAKPTRQGWWGVLSIDAATGDVTRIASAEADGLLRHPEWSADGKTVYFERDSSNQGIVAIDLTTGKERSVHLGNVGNMAVSPDGRWIAFTTDSFNQSHEGEIPALRIVSTAGGEPREIYRSTTSAAFETRSPLAWTRDGRHLLFGTSTFPDFPRSDTKLDLWTLPVEGGSPKSVGLAMPHLTQLRMHPDGRRIAFVVEERKNAIWALENFLPDPPAKP